MLDDEQNVIDSANTYVDDSIEDKLSACERFAEEQFRKPEHQHIKIGLKRLNHSLSSIKSGWQSTSRQQALSELENLLRRQHEIELQAERIENMFLREYVHELLDSMASARRSLGEEIRWDVEAAKLSS